MLEQLRQNSRSFIIWILFAIIILAFVFTFGSQGGLQFDGGSNTATAVMEVDGRDISVESWRFARATLGGSDELERAQVTLDKLLEREILASAARASGLSVTQEAIISEYLGKGKFLALGALQDYLSDPESGNDTGFMQALYDNSVTPPRRSWGISETRLEGLANQLGLTGIDSFIAQQQSEVLAHLMRQTLRASAAVTEDEARAEYEFENTTATVDAVIFKPFEYANRLVLTDEDGERYVAANREKVQEKFKEDERLYKGRKPNIRIRQILIKRVEPEPEPEPADEAAGDASAKPAAKPGAGKKKPAPAKPGAGAKKPAPAAPPAEAGEDESAVAASGGNAKEEEPNPGKLIADQAYRRLQAGEDFATVAKELSQDERTRKKGGDLGWRNAEFPALGDSRLTDAVKTLDAGAYSEVIDTPRGFYILQVSDKREGGDWTFEQAKLEVAAKMMKDDYAEALARADAEAALAKLKAGAKMEDLFEKGFAPQQFPPGFLEQLNQLPPEQRMQILRGMNPQGALTVESSDIPAQSGGAPPAAAAADDDDDDDDKAPAGAADGQAAPADPSAAGGAAAPGMPAAAEPVGASADLPVARPEDVPEPKMQTIGPFRRTSDGSIAGIGESTELVDAIFDDLQAGQVAPRVYEVDGNFVIVEVTSRENPDMSQFDDEARTEIMLSLSAQRGIKLVYGWVFERCVSLNEAGKVKLYPSVIKQLIGGDKPFQYESCKRLRL